MFAVAVVGVAWGLATIGLVKAVSALSQATGRGKASLVHSLLACGFGILICFPWGGTWFHGLEYEDAFEYASAAQLLPTETGEPLVNQVCLFGSVNDCEITGSLSHPIGYTFLISAGYRVVGFHPHVANAVSLLLAGVTGGIVFLLAFATTRSLLAGYAASTIWFANSLSLVLAASSFSEPTGAFGIGASLLIAVVWLGTGEERRSFRANLFFGVGLSASLLIAMLVRRENVALVSILLAAASLGVFYRGAGRRWLEHALFFGSCLLALIFGISLLFDLFVELPAQVGTEEPAFALKNAFVLAPEFVEFLLGTRGFGLVALLIPVGLILGLKEWSVKLGACVAAVYLLLFITFAQSYFFVNAGEIPFNHIERYCFEIGPVLAFLAAVGWYRGTRWTEDRLLIPKWVSVLALGVWAVFGVVIGWQERASRAEDERRSRVDPIIDACQVAGPGSVLITSEVIVGSLYCSPDQIFADYSSLSRPAVSELIERAIQGGRAYYLQGFESGVTSRERWPESFRYVAERKRVVIAMCGDGDGARPLYSLGGREFQADPRRQP